jgi:hypothetical protein
MNKVAWPEFIWQRRAMPVQTPRIERLYQPTVVLVHSPAVGPLTWRSVAAELSSVGRAALVVSLVGAFEDGPPYHARVAARVAKGVDSIATPIVLVGHSGTGPLLPCIAAAVPGPVEALIFADAGLPRPGRSWFDDAPSDLANHLRTLAHDGLLPRWPDWFGPDGIDGLLPDARLRKDFVAEAPRLPLAFFGEPAPSAAWPGPFGYLLLSDAYSEEANRSRAVGAPVVTRLSNHLAMLTRPRMVADALRELLADLHV